MGRKRTRPRGLIYFCAAGLIVFAFQGCASFENTRIEIKERVEAYQFLRRGKKLLAQRDYEGASYENLKILSLGTHRSPEDEALFNLGWICAHSGNPEKDYEKSAFFFKKLLEDFPESSWCEQAKIWVDLLQKNEELTQEKEKLAQRVQALNQTMEEQEKIDKMVEEWDRAREQPFFFSERLLAEGNYEGALKENQRILSLSGPNPPGDEALYRMGVIHAHPGNSKRDYAKSLALFRRLIKDYPGSAWVEQAKTWVGVLQENEKLSRSVEELNLVIEKSKQVDIEIEEKKRGKAR